MKVMWNKRTLHERHCQCCVHFYDITYLFIHVHKRIEINKYTEINTCVKFYYFKFKGAVF